MIMKLRSQKEIPTPKTEMGNKTKLTIRYLIKSLRKVERNGDDLILCSIKMGTLLNGYRI